MGIAGKHVFKTFGPYQDIKVRYVVVKQHLRGSRFQGTLGSSRWRSGIINAVLITPYPAGLPASCTPVKRS